MSDKVTIATIASGYGSVATINANFQALANAIDDLLSRSGESPNQMESALDMNGNFILNAANDVTSYTSVGNGITHTIATASQTVFNSGIYPIGANVLSVYLNGVLQRLGVDYTETTTTTITFSTGVDYGSLVSCVVKEYLPIGNGAASTTTYNPAGSGAVTTNVQDEFNRQVVSALRFMSEVQRNDVRGFVGSSDVSTAWLKARDEAYRIGGVLDNPEGWYNFGSGASGITLLNSVRYSGRGVDVLNGKGTKFIYTGTADAWKITNPINSSTAAHIGISGIYFYAPYIGIDSGCLWDTGSSYLDIDHCRFGSGGCNVILDQSELTTLTYCAFNAYDVGGTCVWLVNGTDKNGGASSYYTNKITVANSGFLSGGAGIYDDGGTSHRYIDNNFDACKYHIVATGVNSLTIDGGEYEVSTEDSIIFGVTKRKLGAGAKSYVVKVGNLFAYNNINKPIVSTVAGALGDIELTNIHLHTVPGRAFSGLELADNVTARGNRQTGTGDTDTTVCRINNHIDNLATTAAWSASVANPSLGNGTLAATYSRRGKEYTYNLLLVFGTTTTLGTGNYEFDLPVAAETTLGMYATGTAWLLVTGTSYYVATVRIESSGTKLRLYVEGTTPVGAAVPAAWTATSRIELSITYTASAPF